MDDNINKKINMIAEEKGYIRHKYLEDLNIPINKYGINFCDNTDPRYPKWMEYKKEYGFDPRETWNLDQIFYEWLYEHVKAYQELNCVNTEYHRFKIGKNEYTQEEAMNKLLKCLKYLITHNYDNYDNMEKYDRKYNKAMEIWAEICPAMWW